MSFRCSLSILLLVASLATLQAQRRDRPQRPPQDSKQFLRDVVAASGRLKYHGHRVMNVRGREYREGIWRSGARFRIEYFSDDKDVDGQILVNDGTNQWHYFKKENLIHKTPAWTDNRFRFVLDAIARPGPAPTIVAGERIAGKRTWLIVVGQPGPESAVHRLWVERRHKAVLKRETQFGDRVRMRWEFKSFSYHSEVSPEYFVLEIEGARIVTPREILINLSAEAKLGAFELSAGSGFLMYRARRVKSGDDQIGIASHYSDGRRFLILSVSNKPHGPRRERTRTPPSGNRPPRPEINRYTWKVGSYYLLIVGSAPVDELRRLAGTVRRIETDGS
ncbi:MAG: hypothetical protein IH944_11295 [Armatimonadetes bacterium]|nr:hypothetical protein [Armatimonadota bacterium]